MPVAYRCRKCRGPALPQPPGTFRDAALTRALKTKQPRGPGLTAEQITLLYDRGLCPHCQRPYRHDRVDVAEGEIVGAERALIRDGESMSLRDLFAGAKRDPAVQKRATGLAGIDWVFDGGLPPFGAILFSGDPGIGKTTCLLDLLLRQAATKLKTPCYYVNAEQSLLDLRAQLGTRLRPPPAKRLRAAHLQSFDEVMEAIRESRAKIAAIDSIHALTDVTDRGGYDKTEGGTAAVSIAGKQIKDLAKELQILIFVVGHVTNAGILAGGRELQHVLDGNLVLRFEHGDGNPNRTIGFEGKTRVGAPGRKARLELTTKGYKDLGPIVREEKHEETQASRAI